MVYGDIKGNIATHTHHNSFVRYEISRNRSDAKNKTRKKTRIVILSLRSYELY